MYFAHSVTLLALVATPLVFCHSDPAPGAAVEEIQKLLEDVDPSKLHSALHDISPNKFRDGIFSQDRSAVEVLHRDDASLASSVVQLAKRADNGTSPAAPVSSSPTEAAPGSTPDVAAPAPAGPTTADAGTTTDAGSGPVTVSSTSTSLDSPAASTAPPSESPSPTDSSSPSAGEVLTTTNAEGFTVITTVGGGVRTISASGSPSASSDTVTSSGSSSRRPSRTSVSLSTATLPNGGKSTVTALTVVNGDDSAGQTPSGTAGAGAASGTEAGAPGLQTGVGSRQGSVTGWLFAVGVGALAFALPL